MLPQSTAPVALVPPRRGPYTGPTSAGEQGSGRVASAARPTTASSAQSLLAPYAPDRFKNAATRNPAPLSAFATPPAVVTPPVLVDEELVESNASLPWITAFIEDAHEVPDTAAPDFGDETRQTIEASNSLHEAPPTIEVPDSLHEALLAVTSSTSNIEAARSDEGWPLDDAGERMRALTTALDSHTTHSDASHASDLPEEEDPRPLPMPMWHDNDFVDVMPVHAASLPADVGTPTPPITMSAFPHTPDLFRAEPVDGAAHASASNEHARISNADATARALEALAWRVRSGDLVIPGFSADRGDAAALATALAALLGAGS